MKTKVAAKIVFSVDVEIDVPSSEIESNPESVQEALKKEALTVIKETGTGAAVVYSSETHPELSEINPNAPVADEVTEGQPA